MPMLRRSGGNGHGTGEHRAIMTTPDLDAFERLGKRIGSLQIIVVAAALCALAGASAVSKFGCAASPAQVEALVAGHASTPGHAEAVKLAEAHDHELTRQGNAIESLRSDVSATREDIKALRDDIRAIRTVVVGQRKDTR